jgi:homoserine O-succinyltransferase
MPLTIATCQLRPPAQGPEADICIGLINNMPDAALEATERQFSALLTAAAARHSVRLIFSSLPEVPRGELAAARLLKGYWPIERLLEIKRLDALIITGMEPGAGPLEDAPCWPRLAQLVDFARERTVSSIWSCLAAHAAVLRLDGIKRQRLSAKCFGVFEHELLRGHPLLQGLKGPLPTPHSRWNELPVGALRAAGYTILSGSVHSGADIFTKEARSRFVLFQGHPEYEEATLLKEYRRDVARFVRGEQAFYPSLPQGYFGAAAVHLLEDFRARLIARPGADIRASFPARAAAGGLKCCSWRAAAVRLYRNWLALIVAARQKLPEEEAARRRAQ